MLNQNQDQQNPEKYNFVRRKSINNTQRLKEIHDKTKVKNLEFLIKLNTPKKQQGSTRLNNKSTELKRIQRTITIEHENPNIKQIKKNIHNLSQISSLQRSQNNFQERYELIINTLRLYKSSVNLPMKNEFNQLLNHIQELSLCQEDQLIKDLSTIIQVNHFDTYRDIIQRLADKIDNNYQAIFDENRKKEQQISLLNISDKLLQIISRPGIELEEFDQHIKNLDRNLKLCEEQKIILEIENIQQNRLILQKNNQIAKYLQEKRNVCNDNQNLTNYLIKHQSRVENCFHQMNRLPQQHKNNPCYMIFKEFVAKENDYQEYMQQIPSMNKFMKEFDSKQ